MDGECLTTEDQKAVVEKLLAYHPHSEDKIGCGLDSIMVCLVCNIFYLHIKLLKEILGEYIYCIIELSI